MKYAFTHGKLLDGTKDMQVQEGLCVLTDGERISAIVPEGTPLDGYTVVDLQGRYLMPGLINMHVHLAGSGKPQKKQRDNEKLVRTILSTALTRKIAYQMVCGFARTELMSGVTTIRTVGGLGNIDSSIRNDINKGKRIGPRMLVSDMAVSVPEGHMAGLLAYEAKTEDDCVRYVRKIAENKPDLIKIMITGGVLDAKVKGEPGVLKMPPELVRACCNEAHRLGYKVAAHIESPAGLRAALENGVDTVEHGADPDEDMIRLFKETGAVQVCTISPAIPGAYFPTEVTHMSEMGKFNSNIVMEGMIACAKKALANGITVGLGTDTACPFVTHYDMWRELVYFKKFVGVSNAFALHTATQVNAKIAGIENETGSVEVGKSADFLITDASPLDDLTALRTPFMVVMKGKTIKQPKVKKFDYVETELDKLL